MFTSRCKSVLRKLAIVCTALSFFPVCLVAADETYTAGLQTNHILTFEILPGENYDFPYDIYVPEGIRTSGTNVALVLSFHGLNSTKEAMEFGAPRPRRADDPDAPIMCEGKGDGTMALADSVAADPQDDGMIVVYFDGYETLVDGKINRSFNGQDCCGQAFKKQIDSVGAVQKIVEKILADYPGINPNRIFATGFSNGGAMVHKLACSTDMLAGIWTAAFPLSTNSDTCDPSHKIPVVMWHGTLDGVIWYYGTPHLNVDSAPQGLRAWKRLNDCSTFELPTVEKPGTLLTTCKTYDKCDGSFVTLCTVKYGSHVLCEQNDEVASYSWSKLKSYTRP